ncbi:hypothetical protein PINS_up014700 [Pythium insidiosum]|nr:hypothetical protein PINS_up014700 [Pythium insidiosum]
MTEKPRVRGTRGCELLGRIASVDPRKAEGLQRDADAPATTQELEQLLEEERRRAITDPYQCFLYDVRAMHKRGNFRGAQGDVILQRIRALIEVETPALDLSGFSIRDDFVELLVPYLRSKTCRITALNVANTQISIDGAVTIARAVNTTLERLQFSEDAVEVATFRSQAQTTRKVTLTDKKYNHLDAAVIGTLIERESRKLERLNVGRNCLTGPHTNVFHGLRVCLQGLTKCHRLRELNLEAVGLRAEGLTELANTIYDMPSLETLVISGNRVVCNSFGDRNVTGVEAFCNALWQVKKLRELSMASNGLDYVCCAAIATMLGTNQRLRRLDLSDNPLSEAGAVELAVGLKKNAILETLELNDNPAIRSSGYKALVYCVTMNPVLLHVDVNPAARYDGLAQQLRELLRVNAAFASLKKGVSSFGFDSLSEALRTNFIEKLKEMSETDLRRLSDLHVIENLQIGDDAPSISSLHHYANMEQYAPLKRLLWVFDASARQARVGARPKRNDDALIRRRLGDRTAAMHSPPRSQQQRQQTTADEDDDEGDDDDIWDYPIVC